MCLLRDNSGGGKLGNGFLEAAFCCCSCPHREQRLKKLFPAESMSMLALLVLLVEVAEQQHVQATKFTELPRQVYTSGGFISHQSAQIHITPMWTLFQGTTHQWRKHTSADANPHVDAVFSSPGRASSNFRICRGRWGFTYFSLHSRVTILEHLLEPNPQVDAVFSRCMNRCPGY